jgi:hypothetical protein
MGSSIQFRTVPTTVTWATRRNHSTDQTNAYGNDLGHYTRNRSGRNEGRVNEAAVTWLQTTTPSGPHKSRMKIESPKWG